LSFWRKEREKEEVDFPPLTSVQFKMATLEESWTKIRLQINSNTQAIKRPAVVLSAIESTLSSSSTSIEPPAYFLALLSTLDQLVQDPNSSKPNSEQRQLLEATLYLLSVLSPHLDPTTLRSKLSSTLATITPLYQAFEQQAPALKSLIQISQSLLSAAPQSTLEKDLQGARSCYAATLSLCADTRPKVRRRAQEAVQHVLKNPPPPGIQHPYADESAGWICQKLDDAIRGAKRGGKKEGKGNVEAETGSDESRAIALLTFTKNMGTAWPQSVCFLILYYFTTSELIPFVCESSPLRLSSLFFFRLSLFPHLISPFRPSPYSPTCSPPLMPPNQCPMITSRKPSKLSSKLDPRRLKVNKERNYSLDGLKVSEKD